jgi:hypothetical protein
MLTRRGRKPEQRVFSSPAARSVEKQTKCTERDKKRLVEGLEGHEFESGAINGTIKSRSIPHQRASGRKH